MDHLQDRSSDPFFLSNWYDTTAAASVWDQLLCWPIIRVRCEGGFVEILLDFVCTEDLVEDYSKIVLQESLKCASGNHGSEVTDLRCNPRKWLYTIHFHPDTIQLR